MSYHNYTNKTKVSGKNGEQLKKMVSKAVLFKIFEYFF